MFDEFMRIYRSPDTNVVAAGIVAENTSSILSFT
jgi:hypothetical protein